jgi:hypothetical protein
MLPNWEMHLKSQVGNISQLGNASQLGNTSQLGNALQMGDPFQKYVGFLAPFFGRVFAFKYDWSGKVYGFFVKYSPLLATRSTYQIVLSLSVSKLI